MSSTHRRVGTTPVFIAVALLWLLSVVLGLAAIYYFHALSILFYDAFIGKEYRVGVLIGQVTAIIGGLIWLSMVIISGEFHLKHAGQRRSWQVIAWMLGVEALIVVAGMLATGAL